MNVSFDIDDTVLASSGCFYYAENKNTHLMTLVT